MMPVSLLVSIAGRPLVAKRGLLSICDQLYSEDELVLFHDGNFPVDPFIEFDAKRVIYVPPKKFRYNAALYNAMLKEATKDIVIFSGQDFIYSPTFRVDAEKLLRRVGKGVLVVPHFETLELGEHGWGSYHRYHEAKPGWSTRPGDADSNMTVFFRSDMQFFDEDFDDAGGSEGLYFGWQWLRDGKRIYNAEPQELTASHVMHEWREYPPELQNLGFDLYRAKTGQNP